MKYLIPLFLMLSACNMSPQDKCDFTNGSRMFMGQEVVKCNTKHFYLVVASHDTISGQWDSPTIKEYPTLDHCKMKSNGYNSLHWQKGYYVHAWCVSRDY